MCVRNLKFKSDSLDGTLPIQLSYVVVIKDSVGVVVVHIEVVFINSLAIGSAKEVATAMRSKPRYERSSKKHSRT